MRRSKAWTAAVVTFLSSLAVAQVARPQDRVLVGATVYRSPDLPPIENAVIVIHQGRIAAVGPRSSTKISSSAQTLDCSGGFAVAGFWNSHVHIFTPGLLHANSSAATDLDTELDSMLNRWGFTTVFDVASVLDNTLALRRRVNSGEVRGPRIFTVGEPLWTAVPIYVRDYINENGIDIPVVRSPEDAALRVQSLAVRGADGIKLFTGSVQANGVANMSLRIVRVAVREAHRRRLPVFAHPQNSAGLEVAIRGGVDVLAHTAPDSPEWTAAFISRLAAAHMALIPTLTLFDFEARKGGASDQERERWLSKMTAELRAFSAGGGQVLFGTDVGYTDHFDTTMELDLMSRGGMKFRQILASLTTNPATRFHAASRSGRVEVGYDADLVVLGSDPAKDVKSFSDVRYTIRAGQIIYARH